MKKLVLLAVVATLITSCRQVDYKDPNAPIEDRVEALLSQMTLEEKVGQMNQFCGVVHVSNMDKKAQAAKARAAKAKAEGDELRDEVFGLLNDTDFVTIPTLVKAIGREDVTSQKVTARLTQLIKLGKVEKSEVSIEVDGKTQKKQGYRVVG